MEPSYHLNFAAESFLEQVINTLIHLLAGYINFFKGNHKLSTLLWNLIIYFWVDHILMICARLRKSIGLDISGYCLHFSWPFMYKDYTLQSYCCLLCGVKMCVRVLVSIVLLLLLFQSKFLARRTKMRNMKFSVLAVMVQGWVTKKCGLEMLTSLFTLFQCKMSNILASRSLYRLSQGYQQRHLQQWLRRGSSG